MQFYRTTGLNPVPSEESKNRLMLGSRLREIFAEGTTQKAESSETLKA